MATSPQKPRVAYVCNACGAAQPKWSGQCADCGAWNTLEEVARLPQGQSRAGGRGGLAGGAGHREAAVQTLADLKPEEQVRTGTGIGELDRVLGGGLVIGSVVLLGGDPGIG
jgi:DNA repair protein RadA/Sms